MSDLEKLGGLEGAEKWYDGLDKLTEIALFSHALINRVKELERELAECELSNEALTKKIAAFSPMHDTCGCSYDKPTDVCAYHSPQLQAAQAKVKELERKLGDAYPLLNSKDAKLQSAQRLAEMVDLFPRHFPSLNESDYRDAKAKAREFLEKVK